MWFYNKREKWEVNSPHTSPMSYITVVVRPLFTLHINTYELNIGIETKIEGYVIYLISRGIRSKSLHVSQDSGFPHP